MLEPCIIESVAFPYNCDKESTIFNKRFNLNRAEVIIYSKYRLFGSIDVMIGSLILVLGILSFGVLAAETKMNDAMDIGVYLPLVIRPESATLTPTVPPINDFEDQVVVLTNQEQSRMDASQSLWMIVFDWQHMVTAKIWH